MLRIRVYAGVLLVVSFAPALAAQSQSPRFEVVSIKQAPRATPATDLAGTTRFAFDVTDTGVQISGYPLRLILTRAFRVQSPQLKAPDFASEQFFDIQATYPAGATRDQVPEMLQSALMDRFKLTYHRETRPDRSDVLTVGKSGIKLERLPDGTRASIRRERLPDGATRTIETATLASLFGTMNSFGGMQLVDETGLKGIYAWIQDVPANTGGESYQNALQESFKAMLQDAGLRLETRMVPKEFIVIDHIEKQPTEN